MRCMNDHFVVHLFIGFTYRICKAMLSSIETYITYGCMFGKIVLAV